MSVLRRLVLVPLIALLALSAAAPLDAMRCETKRACPMMANRAGLCHPQGAATGNRPGELSVPMDCCRQSAIAAAAPAVPGTARQQAALPEIAALPLPLRHEPAAAAHRANHQALGLFTLHAVWRI
ncbi:MAG: hypothetical protein AB7G12_01360 [Thermoanaerobaculia bacterium]